MRRFLVIFTYQYERQTQHVVEGLIHFDGSAYVNGFYPSLGPGYAFSSLADVRDAFRNRDDILRFHIYMIDAEER